MKDESCPVSRSISRSNQKRIFDADENPRLKQAHMVTLLSLCQIYKSLENLDKCEIFTRQGLKATLSNGLPKDQQNKT